MTEPNYLTRLEINPRRRAARKYMTSPQVMHAAVESSFPAATAGQRRLWRIDKVGEATWLYIVSSGKPDLTHIVEDIGRPTLDSWETKEYDPFLDQLAPGQTWAFRLTANPVRSGRPKAGAETQRYGHLTVSQQEAWLLGRLGRFGLEALDTKKPEGDLFSAQILVVGRETVRFGKKSSENRRHQVTIARTSFEGLAKVVDADKLRSVLLGGVGHAKAYGCGLMTLRKP